MWQIVRALVILLFFFSTAEAKLKVDNSDSYVISATKASKNYAFFGVLDGSVRIIDPFSSKLLATINCGSKEVTAISIDNSESTLIVATAGGEITLWDIRNISNKNPSLLKKIIKRGAALKDVMLERDSSKFYLSFSNAIYEYDINTFHNENIFDGFKFHIHSTSIANSLLAIGSTKGDITIINALSGEAIYEGRDFANIISSLSFSKNGAMLLACSYDKSARLYRVQNKSVSLIKKISSFDSGITSCAITEDGNLALFTTEDGNAIMSDIASLSYEDITTLIGEERQGEPLSVASSAISPMGNFLLYSNGKAYEDEHYGLLYFLKSGKYRKFYFYQNSTLAVNKEGYLLGEGDFLLKISLFLNGKKLSKQEILKKYVKEERFLTKDD